MLDLVENLKSCVQLSHLQDYTVELKNEHQNWKFEQYFAYGLILSLGRPKIVRQLGLKVYIAIIVSNSNST